jgi:hypothetical protein
MTCLWDEVLYLPLFAFGATWLATENVPFLWSSEVLYAEKGTLAQQKAN